MTPTTPAATTAPTETVTISGIRPDTGAKGDWITATNPGRSSGPLTVNGTLSSALQPGESVQVSVDGSTWHTATTRGTSWSYTASGVGESTTAVYARVVNSAGTTTPVSHAITVDNTFPSETLSASSVTLSTGAALPTGSTLTQAQTQNMTVSGTFNVAPNSNGGTTETVQVSTDSGRTWNAATVSGTDWSYVSTTTMPIGRDKIEMRVIDAAGNATPWTISTVKVTADSTSTAAAAPTETMTISGISPDTGVKGDWITTTTPLLGTSGALTVSGTLSSALKSGETVQVSLDGSNWYTATTNGTSWSYAASGVGESTTAIYARVVNSAGATTPVTQQITIDNTVPDEKVTIGALTSGTDAITGASLTQAQSQNLTITGTISAALNSKGGSPESVVVSTDGGETWNTATTSGTSWSYHNATAMPLGQDFIIAKVIDVAEVGLPVAASEQVTVTVTVLPASSPVWHYDVSQAATYDASDDFVSITATSGFGGALNGGGGWNTLVFQISNATLDMSQQSANVQHFQEFDLANQSASIAGLGGNGSAQTSNNTLKLNLSDVLTEVNNGDINQNSTNAAQQHMTVMGNSTSTVVLDNSASLQASNWSATGAQQTINGVVFDVYHNATMGANTTADLLIEQGMKVI